jgi:hypothetical protein
MALKLKLNEEGFAEVRDNLPIYVDDDGQELTLNAPELQSKLKAVNHESATRRVKIEEMEAKAEEEAKKWEGLDPEEARQAIETVKSYTEKQLIDAGQVDEVRRTLMEGHDKNMKAAQKEYQSKLDEKDKALAHKTQQIDNLLIKGAFEGSEFLRTKTNLVPEMAYAFFRNSFVVKEIDGQLKAVGMRNGTEILSEATGEVASAEEAIKVLVENYPSRDHILVQEGGGAGVFNPDQAKVKTELSLAETMYPSMVKRQ